MMRNHMQRWGWKLLSVKSSDETTNENCGAGDGASWSFDENDENKPIETKIVSTPEDVENGTSIHPTNQKSWRRSSDGSDGLKSPDKDIQNDVRSPTSTSVAKHKNCPSPLSTINQWNPLQSPRNHHLSAGEGHSNNKIRSTPGSTPTRRSLTSVDANNLIAPLCNQNIEPTVSCILGKTTDKSEVLYAIDAVHKISNEEISQQMEKLEIGHSSNTYRDFPNITETVSNTIRIHDSSCTNHDKVQSNTFPRKVKGLETAAMPSHVNVEIQSINNIEDSDKDMRTSQINDYGWAYNVWERKGLISKSKNDYQFKSSTATSNTHRHTNDNIIANGSRSIYKNSNRYTKPWNNDRESFSNILDQWKSKTEEQPFDSPGSSTVFKMEHRSNLNPQQVYKVDATSQISREDKKNILVSATSIHVAGIRVNHPASSIPIVKIPSPKELSSHPSTPKSQAKKLQETQNKKVLSEHNLRCTWNPDAKIVGRLMKSPGKGHNVNDSLNNKGCLNAEDSSIEIVTPTPLVGSTIHIPESIHTSLQVGPLDVDNSCHTTIQAVNSSAPLQKMRSKSQPRPRQTYRTLAMKNIYENTCSDFPKKFLVNQVDSKPPMKVLNLDISRRAEEKIINIPSKDELDLFSPYTQRLMRNLGKVYKERGNISGTSKGSDVGCHPWQHDRLLHRVGSFTDEATHKDSGRCTCSNSVFTDTDDVIDFFLPLMGTACLCGKKTEGLVKPNTPTSLVNILRPWQVEFLSRFGIYYGEELVKSFHRSGIALAKAMVKFRSNEGMTPFPLKSCIMALQIWSKTSKSFVRSIRDQLTNVPVKENHSEQPSLVNDGTTKLKLPNTLYILSSFMEKVPDIDNMHKLPYDVPTDVYRSLDRPSIMSPSANADKNNGEE